MTRSARDPLVQWDPTRALPKGSSGSGIPRRHSDGTLTEAHVHRGHSIALTLTQLGRETFEWTYFIDSTYCRQGRAGMTTLDLVRKDALAYAHASIETLERMRLPTPSATAAATRSMR